MSHRVQVSPEIAIIWPTPETDDYIEVIRESSPKWSIYLDQSEAQDFVEIGRKISTWLNDKCAAHLIVGALRAITTEAHQLFRASDLMMVFGVRPERTYLGTHFYCGFRYALSPDQTLMEIPYEQIELVIDVMDKLLRGETKE